MKTVKTAPKRKQHLCLICDTAQISTQAICRGCNLRISTLKKNDQNAEGAILLKCLRAKEYRDIKTILSNYV